MNSGLNLMSPVSQKRVIVRASIRSWIRLTFLFICLLGFDWTFCWFQARAAKMRRQSLEMQYEPVKLVKADTLAANNEVERLVADEAVALALSVERSPVVLFGAVGLAAGEAKQEVYLKSFEYRTDGLQTRFLRPNGQLRLRGTGRDDEAISEFIAELKKSPIFASVQLISSVSKRINQEQFREFQIECSVN